MKRFFDLILDTSPDAIFLEKLDGTILDCNQTAIELYGYTREEFKSILNVHDLTSEEYYKMTLPKLMEIGKKTGKFFTRTINRKKDGSSFSCEVYAKFFNHDNETLGIVYVRDITCLENEKTVLEDQLKNTSKLEAVGLLAGGIAHDFNNILTVIKGYSEELMNKLVPDSNEQVKVGKIFRASERAEKFVKRLLAFSKKQMMKMETIDPNQFLSEQKDFLSQFIKEDIDFSLNLSPDIKNIKIDTVQFQSVLINICINAIDAMPDGGKLVIKTENVESIEPFDKRGSFVLISISDTGVGMTKEVKDRLFEPFFTTKPLGRGTGLGLPVVYGIVKQSNGHIWVESEPGHGATFYIYFPSTDDIAVKRFLVDKINENDIRGTETVLLVEDELEVRNLIKDRLENSGYTVIMASNGVIALEKVETLNVPIDIVLTDVVMPKMNGVELVENLIKKYPKIKTLYMSGYTDNTIVHYGILHENINFIEKPVTPLTILKRVRDVLDSK